MNLVDSDDEGSVHPGYAALCESYNNLRLYFEGDDTQEGFLNAELRKLEKMARPDEESWYLRARVSLSGFHLDIQFIEQALGDLSTIVGRAAHYASIGVIERKEYETAHDRGIHRHRKFKISPDAKREMQFL